MQKLLKKFKIKKLVDDKYVKEEVEHEWENDAENEDEYKFVEERTRKWI